jgi:hypothetical protein
MKLIYPTLGLMMCVLAACGSPEHNAQDVTQQEAAKQAKIAEQARATMQQAEQVSATVDAQAQAQKAQIDEQTQ